MKGGGADAAADDGAGAGGAAVGAGFAVVVAGVCALRYVGGGRAKIGENNGILDVSVGIDLAFSDYLWFGVSFGDAQLTSPK